MRLRAGHDPDSSPVVRYTVLMRSDSENFRAYPAGSKVLAEGRPRGRRAAFLLTVVSTYDAEDTVSEAKARLDRAEKAGMGISAVAAREWFRHSWSRSWIRLPDVKLSRPWYRGVYEAMCARKPGRFAAGYLAPWYQSSLVNWGHHILTYEQAKTNLGLLSTNHAELLEPWFRLLTDSEKKLSEFTKGCYRLNGTAYPHAISGTGTVVASCVNLNGTEMNIQTTGESVKYCWDYYEHTGDEDFLREVGYPLIKQAAVFYHEYLLTDENGERYVFPSRSQEYVNTVGLSNEFMTNSLIDLCLVRHTLKNAAAAARILGEDAALAEEWEKDVAAMRPDYATWPDGTWKDSEDQDDLTLDYGPPGVTRVAPVAYTGEVDAWHGPSPDMIEAAEKTVHKLIPDDEIPWDRSFGIIARLRMGDKGYGGRMLRMIPDEYEIGGNLDAPIAPDCDYCVGKGTAATAEVINEMLLQSQGGVIRVFPAWDSCVGDAAFWSLRARGAFLVSAEHRAGRTAYVLIRSLRGGECSVAQPFGGETAAVRDLETGESVGYENANGVLRFRTEEKHEYVIERPNEPLESFPVID